LGLRARVLQGGTYYSIRQLVGAVIGVGGVTCLIRILGPHDYGVFASAFGVYIFLRGILQLGVGTYLVRKDGAVDDREFSQALAIVFSMGVLGVVVAISSVHFLQMWIGIRDFTAVSSVLLLALPLGLSSSIGVARLERAIDYRSLALADVAAQTSYYLVALPSALLGLGVWAPVIGWWASEIVNVVLTYQRSAFRPKFYWSSALAKNMITYGFGFSSSFYIWQARSLVNPLLVGRYAGAEAVAYVALTIRIVEYLCFIKTSAWRLSIVAFARVQGNTCQLAKAVSEGMDLQMISQGPLLVVFGWVAPWIVPRVFGDRWLPVLDIYPFIALAYLTNALFNLHSSVLYVLARNLRIAIFNVINVAILLLGSSLLVPKHGYVGYGIAEILALTSCIAIHYFVRQRVGRLRYLPALAWYGGMAPSLFWHDLGIYSIVPLVIVVAWPVTYIQLKNYVYLLGAWRSM